MTIPELLAPAGSLEKLKVAITYGADAVYLGGPQFGLRSAAQNFSALELQAAVDFAHQRGALVFVVINGFLFDQELEQLPDFIRQCSQQGVDAFIVSDPGSLECIRRISSVPIHLSTQASCLNSEAGKYWRDLGVKRLILGRESSWQEARAIKDITGLEVEVFVHGALCMSYSGHCVISNYTQGRDSNRGGCAQSCRFNYSLNISGAQTQHSCQSTFLSSKDLNTLDLIPQIKAAGIDSLKIEGRMKTSLYAGLTTKIYRQALDHGQAAGPAQWQSWARELESYSHRQYTATGLGGEQFADSVFAQESADAPETHFIGQVLKLKGPQAVIELRSNLFNGEEIEWLPIAGPAQALLVEQMQDVRGRPLDKGHPGKLVLIKASAQMAPLTLLRRRGAKK